MSREEFRAIRERSWGEIGYMSNQHFREVPQNAMCHHRDPLDEACTAVFCRPGIGAKFISWLSP